FSLYVVHQHLPSFPTRRSSDLGAARADARQELPPGGGARVGVLDATRRPRPRARAAHAAVQALQGAPPGEGRRVSDTAPLVEELVPAPDPVEACARFADLPFVVLLDSATHPDQVGRHTFLTADPATVVRSKGALTQQLDAGRWTRISADPVAHVGALLDPFAAEPGAGIPPFQGRATGSVRCESGDH